MSPETNYVTRPPNKAFHMGSPRPPPRPLVSTVTHISQRVNSGLRLQSKVKTAMHCELNLSPSCNFLEMLASSVATRLMFTDNMTIGLLLPSGEHLYCGLWRHVSRDHPGPAVCFHLHLLWGHFERHAHFHPVQ